MKNFIEPDFDYSFKLIRVTPAHIISGKASESFSDGKSAAVFYRATRNQAAYLFTNYFKTLLFSILSFWATSTIKAQQDVSYAVHANIIYRFTKYISWPVYGPSADFIIGIVGATPLYEELESFIANKTVGNRKIIIKKMSSSADEFACQILFISEDQSGSLKKIAEITKGSSILIVSESSGQSTKGSCINFVIINDHLKLEINKSNIEGRNLSIATELLSLGRIVK